jgi:hypothetical protein
MKQEVVELGKYMPYTDVLINEVKELVELKDNNHA